jgi:hypothetical protein
MVTAYNGNEEHEMAGTGQNDHHRSHYTGLSTEMSDNKMDSLISMAKGLLFKQRRLLSNLQFIKTLSLRKGKLDEISTNHDVKQAIINEGPLLGVEVLENEASSIPTKLSQPDESGIPLFGFTAIPTTCVVGVPTTSSATSSYSTLTSFFDERATKTTLSSTTSFVTPNLSLDSSAIIVPRSIPLITPSLISGSSVIFLTIGSSRSFTSQVSTSSATPFLAAAQQSASSALSSASAALAAAQSSASAAVGTANQQLNDARGMFRHVIRSSKKSDKISVASASSALRAAQSSATAINVCITSHAIVIRC